MLLRKIRISTRKSLTIQSINNRSYYVSHKLCKIPINDLVKISDNIMILDNIDNGSINIDHSLKKKNDQSLEPCKEVCTLILSIKDFVIWIIAMCIIISFSICIIGFIFSIFLYFF